VYDPEVISYEDILEHFAGQGGLSKYQSYNQQYRSAILVHTPEQQRMATEFVEKMQKVRRCQYFVDIEPASDFYRAEEYHQKYVQKEGRTKVGCGIY
jgi:peptide methionine sulfoxide reductase MsrA